MSVAYGDIARVLDGARRRQFRVIVLASAGFALAAALVLLLGGATALWLGARIGVRPLALAAAGTAVIAVLVLAVRAVVSTAWSHEAAARTVGHDEPALRSALLSSVQLSREREDIQSSGRFSVALVDAHVARTAERARGVDLSRVISDRWARRGGIALVAVLAVHALAFVLGGRGLTGAYARVLSGDPAGTPAPLADPITGDIELTYSYPAYMKREPRTLSGTGGEIRAPKGTEVSLKTRADRPVKVAEMAVDLAIDPAVAKAGPEVVDEESGTAVPLDEKSVEKSGHPERSGANGPGHPERSGAYDSGHPERSGAEGDAKSRDAESRDAKSRDGRAPPTKRYALAVSGDRDLQGRLLVEEGGSYRFRFIDPKGKLVAEGPPIAITVEPDAYPEIRVVAPERDIEVESNAVVRIDWQAEDDFGLGEIALVTKPDGGVETRRLISRPDGARRDGGSQDLELAQQKLAEGERLLFWLEAVDGDTVSGPKKAISETHTVRIYSEAEHRRQVLEKAKEVFEELVVLLADRLETLDRGSPATPELLPAVQQLDVRTRVLHERMREAATEIRKDPAGPRDIAAALRNVASGIRLAEARVTNARASVAQAIRVRIRPESSVVRHMKVLDGALDAELERSVLYLEQLLDKRRAEDLVRLAKDLAARRRDLAGLMEKYRASPSENAKKDLVAQIGRMKERVKELLSRMSELSKGFNDEHMNAEALAEMQRSQDLLGGLDKIEEMLAKGDVEGAMKALDQMASTMDRMLAGLERTAGMPDERAQALMKEMLAFKEELEQVQRQQGATAAETDKIRAEYRKRMQEKLKDVEAEVKRLEKLAQEARRDVEEAQPGVTFRAEVEYEQSKESLADLERALGMRELGAAWETSQRAAPAVERLSRYLEEESQLAEGPLGLRREGAKLREAHERVDEAVPKTREIRDALSKMFPDPRTVLPPDAQKRLGDLAQRQGELEKRAQGLQERLSQLMQQAPIFPPEAQGQLGETRGHMGQAAAELGNRNPQRGHGEQELAMDALSRFQKGLEEAAKKGQGQGGGGMGFPFPFADSSGGQESGDGRESSREPVKIPGAEAYRVPEEFRKDLLDAMKQGAPERYKGEVQRYYEELVK